MLTSTTLILRPVPTAVRAATAWFLPGAEPLEWLHEVSRWPATAEAVRFYRVPAGASGQLAGVLAVPPAGMERPTAGFGHPYGEIVSGFFLPVDGVLWPAPATHELAGTGTYQVRLFHPVHGLSAYEEADACQAWDLLAPAPLSEERWNAACAPLTVNTRLRNVRLATPLAPADIFGEESREIGSAPLVDLPPAPSEPRTSLPGKFGWGAAALAMKGLLALVRMAPVVRGAPTWLNSIEEWARDKAAGINDELDRQRHRELHRLLALLATNPDEALRHAISLAALAHRGQAAPSTRLASRSVDFDARRLGGGQAADAWNVPPDLQSSLAKRYREAAEREARLGHHRRAAYIYAELLGDLTSAAEALKQGAHYREAALLYQEHLKKPLLAAACLAAGGLLVEAIELYERHGQWLDAATLHTRRGDREAACAAVRRAVELNIKAGDLLAAARLLETRLDAPDESLDLLASTWPNGAQALPCLEERFALLGRLKRSDASLRLLVELRSKPVPPARLVGLTALLGHVANTAADARVRRQAADTARSKASLALGGQLSNVQEQNAILATLRRLVPADRLLARDTQRFGDRRRAPAPPLLPAPRAPGLIRRISLGHGPTLNLPKVGLWARVIGDAHGFAAVARQSTDKIFFTRATWKQAQQSANWPDPVPERGTSFMLAACGDLIVLGRPFGAPLAQNELPASDVFEGRACRVGTPAWLPDDTVQVAPSTEREGALWSVRVVGDRIVLTSYLGGSTATSLDVSDELTAAGATGGGTGLALDAHGAPGCVALGYGTHVLVLAQSRTPQVRDLGARVLGLVPGLAALPGWIALLECGATFVHGEHHELVCLDDTMTNPLGVFLGDERLVLLGANEGKVFQHHEGRLHPVGWFPFVGDKVIGMTATDDPHGFATFTEKGAVHRWVVPVA